MSDEAEAGESIDDYLPSPANMSAHHAPATTQRDTETHARGVVALYLYNLS